MTNAIKVLLQMTSVSLQPVPSLVNIYLMQSPNHNLPLSKEGGIWKRHDLLYNIRPVHFIKKALRKCFRERTNFRHSTGASKE
jgi:hypothetical protein